MNNKYVMTRFKNVAFVKNNLNDYLYNCMKLARYDVSYEQCLQMLNAFEEETEEYVALINFKKAIEYLIDSKDEEIDYAYLLKLHSMLMHGLMENINNDLNEEQINYLVEMINQPAKANTEIALDVMMYILDGKLFADGDVRVALMFANKIMLENGCGFITIAPSEDDTFRQYLKSDDKEDFKNWLYKYCVRGKKYEY